MYITYYNVSIVLDPVEEFGTCTDRTFTLRATAINTDWANDVLDGDSDAKNVSAVGDMVF
jgi:hypothetical protein